MCCLSVCFLFNHDKLDTPPILFSPHSLSIFNFITVPSMFLYLDISPSISLSVSLSLSLSLSFSLILERVCQILCVLSDLLWPANVYTFLGAFSKPARRFLRLPYISFPLFRSLFLSALLCLLIIIPFPLQVVFISFSQPHFLITAFFLSNSLTIFFLSKFIIFQ